MRRRRCFFFDEKKAELEFAADAQAEVLRLVRSR